MKKTTGGKFIGLALDSRGKPTQEVRPDDPTAVQWFDTNKYKMVSKQEAMVENRPITPPVAPGSPLKGPRPSSVSGSVGFGRRKKTRRGKSQRRRVTRKR